MNTRKVPERKSAYLKVPRTENYALQTTEELLENELFGLRFHTGAIESAVASQAVAAGAIALMTLDAFCH
ncbi:MAG: hypothetical protein Q7R41_02465 [Phycisphaerales bacterium]|nr:hypothetical protein [Phycisphaerales bacterium]